VQVRAAREDRPACADFDRAYSSADPYRLGTPRPVLSARTPGRLSVVV